MRLAFLDSETTGLDPDKGHRLIEVCVAIYSMDESVIRPRTWRINPEREVDPDAQATHGIATADLRSEPRFADVAVEIGGRIASADIVIAHNIEFDHKFLVAEFAQAKVGLPVRPLYCTAKNGRWATFDGKTPSLKELCFALGIEYDEAKAHAAEYDVDRLAACFLSGLDRGVFPLPT